jgi:maltose alpha-D-glucosyltransferase/alpha-amylase
MLDRLAMYNEKVLSNTDISSSFTKANADMLKPETYDQLPADVKELLETPVAERVRTLGVRTAEMHAALGSSDEFDAFRPEEFSLHYQRSLFSSFQTLVRKTYQTLAKNLKKLPDDVRAEAEELMGMKDTILAKFKTVYQKKFDSVKIRIHGDYHLGQVLLTGKDIYIIDFEGEPARTYSERRIKRSALRDVAGMLRSFHYAAYASLFLNNGLRKEDIQKLVPFAEQWQQYMCGFYLQAYLHTVDGSRLVPQDKEDLTTLLQVYILEKAVYELNYELNNRPDWVIIPIRGIKAILNSTNN